jgi:putative FmdB family regulatory protein
MPTYEYRCDKCGTEVDYYQNIKDKPKRKCPVCKKNGLSRLLSACIGFVSREVTTIGQLAERNSKKMGSKIKEEEDRSGKTEAKKKKREISKINKMTLSEKIRYIEEG